MITLLISLKAIVLIMSELLYLLSVLTALGLYAVAGLALWGAVEGVYYIFCKATGREY